MVKNTLAFILPGLGSGGAERVVTILANKLSEDYRIVLITLYKTYPFYPLHPDIKVLHCLDLAPNSKDVFQAVRSNYILVKKISSFLKQENVKLAIGFLTSANVLAVLSAKMNNIPVIISERNNPNLSKTPLFWKLLRKLTYPKADFLVVQTEEIRNYYVNSIKHQRLLIIANPISPELTMAKEKGHCKEKVILNVGRLTNQKAQHVLIQAFAEIDNEGWELHIVGKGSKEREYRILIESLHLQDKVKLLPPTKQIEKHYNSASIFAFVSIFEGFPNALIEAMHFGLPCISTDCPSGPSVLIQNNENGFLIPMNNQNALKEHLKKLMGDEKLRSDFGKNAAISVLQFEAVNIVKQWESLIEKTLN